MARIPQDVIDSILSGIDIHGIVSDSVSLTAVDGDKYTCVCPFHRGEDRSMVVDVGKGAFECQECHFSGSAIGWLMFYHGLPFPAAVYQLAKMAGVDVSAYVSRETLEEAEQKQLSLLEEVSKFYHRNLSHDHARSYLGERGISAEAAAEFQIGFAGFDKEAKALLDAFPGQARALWMAGVLIRRQDKSYYPRFQNRIVFPIHDFDGRVVGFGGRSINDYLPKYLNSSSSMLFDKSGLLYSSPALAKRCSTAGVEPLLIVEGYTDVIAVRQHTGIDAVGTMGTALSASHIKQARKRSGNIIICFDGDQAGRKAAIGALAKLCAGDQSQARLSVMTLPDRHDPDSFIRQFGAEEFERKISDAVPALDCLVQQVSNGLDLHSIGDKARLAMLAKPIIAGMTPGDFRSEFQRMIEALVGVPIMTDNA